MSDPGERYGYAVNARKDSQISLRHHIAGVITNYALDLDNRPRQPIQIPCHPFASVLRRHADGFVSGYAAFGHPARPLKSLS